MAPNFIRAAQDSKSAVWGGNAWQLGNRGSSEHHSLFLAQNDLQLARVPRAWLYGWAPSPGVHPSSTISQAEPQREN